MDVQNWTQFEEKISKCVIFQSGLLQCYPPQRACALNPYFVLCSPFALYYDLFRSLFIAHTCMCSIDCINTIKNPWQYGINVNLLHVLHVPLAWESKRMGRIERKAESKRQHPYCFLKIKQIPESQLQIPYGSCIT
jgi:hypothetical protein